jgi:hypothetical protein
MGAAKMNQDEPRDQCANVQKKQEVLPEEPTTPSISYPDESFNLIISTLTKTERQDVKIDELQLKAKTFAAENKKIATSVIRLEEKISTALRLQEERLRAENEQGETTRTQLLSKALRTAFATVLLLIASNFVSSYFQVKAEKSRQLFNARADTYKSIIDQLGSIESDAKKLQWEISDVEASQSTGINPSGILEAQARIFIDRSLDISQRLQGLPFPPEWNNTKTAEGLAAQQAWYEVYALIGCLERTPSDIQPSKRRSVKGTIDLAVQEGKLDPVSAAKIAKSAVDKLPCSRNFQPGLIQTLRARTAEAAWKHLSDDTVSSFF